MVRDFVVLAEIVAWPFVVSAEIVMVRPPTRLVSDPWEEHYEARRKYSKALEVWRQAENLVNLNVERTASACRDSAEYTSETAHHVRRSLARSVVGKIETSELCEV